MRVVAEGRLDNESGPRAAPTAGGQDDHVRSVIDMAERTCSIAGCSKKHWGRGWCSMHYERWRKWGDPGVTKRIYGDAPARFWLYVDKGDSGCWTWTGGSRGEGYGAFWDGTRRVRSHRYAYELLVGPIPEGLHLDHLCRNHACVNPAHLEAVENTVNVLRGVGAPAQNARKTECIHGHPLEGDNLVVRPSGRRDCLECHRRRGREQARRARQRARAS